MYKFNFHAGTFGDCNPQIVITNVGAPILVFRNSIQGCIKTLILARFCYVSSFKSCIRYCQLLYCSIIGQCKSPLKFYIMLFSLTNAHFYFCAICCVGFVSTISLLISLQL